MLNSRSPCANYCKHSPHWVTVSEPITLHDNRHLQSAHATSSIIVRQNCLYWLGIFVLVRLCLDIILKLKFITHLFDKSSGFPPSSWFEGFGPCLPGWSNALACHPDLDSQVSVQTGEEHFPSWNVSKSFLNEIPQQYSVHTNYFLFIYADVSNHFAFYFVLQSPTLVPMGNPLPIAVS